MDIGIKAAREQVARERLAAAAKTLAARFGLPEPTWPTGNQPELVALWRMEAVADLLDGLVGATEPKTTKSKRNKAEPSPDAPAGEEVEDDAG